MVCRSLMSRPFMIFGALLRSSLMRSAVANVSGGIFLSVKCGWAYPARTTPLIREADLHTPAFANFCTRSNCVMFTRVPGVAPI